MTLSLRTLFEQSLREAGGRRVVAVFPGRFQPFHAGHKEVYDKLVGKFGAANVFLSTTDDTSSFKSPFTFNEKRLIMTRLCGIPGANIIQTSAPYSVPEVGLDGTTTVLLFAVSEKDMQDDARFTFVDGETAMKKDGTPQYLQKFPGAVEDCDSLASHGYVIEVPVETFTIFDKPVTSATQVRELLVADEAEAKDAFEQLYGKFDQELFDMIRNRIEAKTLSLTEGGNVWGAELATRKINKSEVAPTVAWLEKLIGIKLGDKLLGSAGKADNSGDIDIALTDDTKAAVEGKLKAWASMKDPAALSTKTGINIHFRAPIGGNAASGYVQVDFTFVPDIEFAKWKLAHPKSQYSGTARAIVMASLAKAAGLKLNMNGLVGRNDDHPIEGGKNPDVIAQYLLGKGARASDLDSVESVLAKLKNDPDGQKKLADARDTLRRQGIVI